jgi:amidase/aspartyl-tRNA(Asn)/glutamyl-tRNA(Gln) amidotransferase subunit A
VSGSGEIVDRGVAALALLIRQRLLSPVELLEACIARIEARNPSLNALVHLGFEEARAAARAAERAVMAGGPLGPLHGVPTALKDLFDAKAGWPSTLGGIGALRDNRAKADGNFAHRLQRAGAIPVGKTNSPVMGFRGVTDNPLFGPTGNPFDPGRNAGGSSGGSAAAVGDGMLPFAVGSDGGGSIRIPAAWCGVYGYKAAFGRIPRVTRPNAFGSAAPFVFDGPLTRSVEDAALVMSAVAGHDPRDPLSLPDRVDYLAALHLPVRGWRIAYSRNLDVFPVDPRVVATVDRAVQAFAEAGAIVEEVELGLKRPQMELSDLWCRMLVPLNLQGLAVLKAATGIDLGRDHHDDLPAEYWRWVDGCAGLSALDWLNDQIVRTEVHDAIAAVLDRHRLLVSPTLACLPVANAADGNTLGPTRINGEAVDPLIGWCLTYPINFSGHPAASVPAGLAEGLPVGMQIVGRRYADADVIAASAAFERLRPWRDDYRICRDRAL